MAKRKLKSLITCFTPEGDYLAILSPDGVVKIWNTSNACLLAEWHTSDLDPDIKISCMTCSFVGKKRRKECGTCLLALGSDAGEIWVVDVFASLRKWKSTGNHASGIAGLSFTNRGRILRTVGINGMAYEIKSETGELVRDFKVSKTQISSSAISCDEKILVVANGMLRITSWEDGKQLLKFSADEGQVKCVSVCEEAKAIVTYVSGEKHLQLWKPDLSSGAVSKGPVLSMRHAPFSFECKSVHNGDGLVVLSVSKLGVAYVWNLKTISGGEISPIKVMVNGSKAEMDLQNSAVSKKTRTSVIAARLQALDTDDRPTALIAYGSIDSPQFCFVDISKLGEDTFVIVADEINKLETQENGVRGGKGLQDVDSEAMSVTIQNKKSNKKRFASDLDSLTSENLADNGHGMPMDGSQIDDDLMEPTMGEKLASLNLLGNNADTSILEEDISGHTKPPSADSMHVLLKQALHADDRALLLNCLNIQDEKVITNSVSLLNPSDVLKLLDSLVSVIHYRGAALARALPWLRSLLLQHASGIASQESSLLALNSLYQLIESRVSNFHPAVQLSSCLDLLYTATVDEGLDEDEMITPVIYEDKDESDEEEQEDEESDDAMETGALSDEHEAEDGDSDIEGSDHIGF